MEERDEERRCAGERVREGGGRREEGVREGREEERGGRKGAGVTGGREREVEEGEKGEGRREEEGK